MHEKGLHFGNSMLSGKTNDANYFDTKFYSNTIKLIRDVFLEVDMDIKDHQNVLPPSQIEEYLKWLYFYCIESENIKVINNFLKIVLEIYKTCNILFFLNIF